MTAYQSPPEMLATIGCALYGAHFRGPLATELGVSEKTMRDWLHQRRDIPGGIWDDLFEIIEQHQNRIAIAMASLNRNMRLATVNRPSRTTDPGGSSL